MFSLLKLLPVPRVPCSSFSLRLRQSKCSLEITIAVCPCSEGCIILPKYSSTPNFSPSLPVSAISFSLSTSSFSFWSFALHTLSPPLLSSFPSSLFPHSCPRLPPFPTTSFFKVGIRCVYIKFVASGKLQLPHFFILYFI